MADLVSPPDFPRGTAVPCLPAGPRPLTSDWPVWAGHGLAPSVGVTARLSVPAEPTRRGVHRGMGTKLGQGGQVLHLRTRSARSLRRSQPLSTWPLGVVDGIADGVLDVSGRRKCDRSGEGRGRCFVRCGRCRCPPDPGLALFSLSAAEYCQCRCLAIIDIAYQISWTIRI